MLLKQIHSKPSVVMLTGDRRIDRRILLQADSLQAAGWNVTILAMPLESGDIDTDPRIIRVGTCNQIVNVESKLLQIYQWLRQKLPKDNAMIQTVKKIIWRYFVNQKGFYLKYFEEHILNMSATIFMAHDLPMLPLAAIAAKRCGAKLIYDSHELYCEQELSIREKKYWKKKEQKYIHSCDAVITINSSIADILEKVYKISDVQVIYNAERKTKNARKHNKTFHKIFNLHPKRKILLFQGNLSPNRNIANLIDAMRKVNNSHLDLVILGSGPLRIVLERQVKSAGLSQRVYFHAAVPQCELLELTASADVGIIPYQATCLNNYYCTPNKLFEFIAAGIPVLASDLPEIRRIVVENNIGLIGNMNSSDTIADMFENYFSDEARITYWRDQVLITQNDICWENEGKKLISIFEKFNRVDMPCVV